MFIAIFRRLKFLVQNKQIDADQYSPFVDILHNQLPDLDTFLQLTDYNLLSFFHLIKTTIEDDVLNKLINIFLYPSAPFPYLLDFGSAEVKANQNKGWSREYFYYQNHFVLNIYQKNEQQIWI